MTLQAFKTQLSLSPSSANYTNTGGTGTITISLTDGGANGTNWYAAVGDTILTAHYGTTGSPDDTQHQIVDWITITSASGGSGNGTLTFSVAAWSGGTGTRSGGIIVNNQLLTIRQTA
jgi:hypothetical protein